LSKTGVHEQFVLKFYHSRIRVGFDVENIELKLERVLRRGPDGSSLWCFKKR